MITSIRLPATLLLAAVLGAGQPHSKLADPDAGRVERDGQTWVKGQRIAPGAHLRGVDLGGTDLHGVLLRHADLGLADLRGADLRWADLSYANLKGAKLEGARLDGTRLFKAKVFGARGARFDQAHLHPFFDEERPERVGVVRVLQVSDRRAAPEGFHSLVTGPAGNIYWLRSQPGSLACLASTGATFEPNPRSPHTEAHISAMGLTGADTLMMFGARSVVRFNLSALEGARPDGEVMHFSSLPQELPGPPRALLPSPWGTAILLWPQLAAQVLTADSKRLEINAYNIFPGFVPDRLAFDPEGPIAYFIHPQDRRLLVHRLAANGSPGKMFGVPLASQALPDLLALGPGRRIWTARRGEAWLTAYDQTAPPAGAPLTVTLPEGAGIHQITLGPDGNLWATAPDADRLFRITGSGEVSAFPVPRGTRPGDILPYLHGRLLFASLAGHSLGSIRAVAAAGRTLPDWPEDAGQDSPQVQPLSDAALAGALARAETARAIQLALDSDEPPDPEEAGPAQAPALEPPAPEQAATVSARKRLAGGNLLLTAGAIRHILGRHRHGLDNGNSLFLARFSHPGELGTLLADGIAAAARDDLVGRVRTWDRRERGCTFCRMDQTVGTYRRHGQDLETHTFMVVTTDTYDRPAARWMHAVVTAFPVAP